MSDERTPEAIASRLISSWERNPAMWLTHGLPGDEKLAIMATEIAAEVHVDRNYFKPLIAKARNVVDLLADAEQNHGGLVGTKTLRAANEMRLELDRFKEGR